jgi:ABC-type transport system involved in multi-copper enzyme maturation permease subunit
VAVLLGALAVWLWSLGAPLHRAYAAAVACHPASSPACQDLVGIFNSMGNHMTGSTSPAGVFLQLVPVLIGAFVGAPVLARELETGTFRYAWTQGFGRWRWALAKLVPLAVLLVAATAAFGALLSWYYQPYLATGNQALGLTELSPFNAELFDLHEVTFPAWTLAAFAIGVLVGMLIRRVVPAIAATLAVYAGLGAATGLWLRQHYMTPLLTTKLNLPSSAWYVSQWYTKGGQYAFGARGSGIVNAVTQLCPSFNGSPTQCLSSHGYTQWTSYQPGSRFWPFQWIEGGWLLALSVLLIAATVWLIRRRAT